MNSNPKISVIVPMYNCAEYAPKCIENIIKQTYPNWELWLVNGDSNDGTETVCQKYESKDKRIKNIFHIDGLVSKRNVGYEHATGDWIMYIDGDDWIDTNTFEELIGIAAKYNNPDIIFWNCIQEFGDISIKGKWEWRCQDAEHIYKNDECMMLSQNTLIYKSGIATAYSKLIRRDFCLNNNLDHNHNLRQGIEGVEFSMRVFAAAKTALFVHKYYNHYRYNPTSISKKVDEKNSKYIHDGLLECYKFIEGIGPKRDVFLGSLYQRSLYALIAVAMSTYFNPTNTKNLSTKISKFNALLRDMKMFNLALKNADLSCFDKQRKIIIYIIKLRLYFLLPLVATLKQYYLKKGKYNY